MAGPDNYISVVYLICGFALCTLYHLTPNSKTFGRIAIRLAVGYAVGSVLSLQIIRVSSQQLKPWEWYIIASFAGLCLGLLCAFLKYISDALVGLYFGLIFSSFLWGDIAHLEAHVEGSQMLSDTIAIICGFLVLIAGQKTDSYFCELLLTFVHATCGSQLFLQALGCFWANIPVVQPYWIFFYTGNADKFAEIQCNPPATDIPDRLASMGIVLGMAILCGILQIIIFSVRANCMLQNWRERPYLHLNADENEDEEEEDSEEMFNPSTADIENDEGALAEFSLPVNGFTNNGLVCFISSVIQALRVVDPLIVGLRNLPNLSEFSLALLPKALNTSIMAIRERIDSKKFPMNKQADAHEFLLYLLSFFQSNGGSELVTRCFQAHIDRKIQCTQCGKVSNLPTEPVFDVMLGIQNQTSLNRAWSKEFATETVKDYHCETCQQTVSGRKTTNLIPPVNPEFHMIVTLKWFVDDTKINQNFDIPLVMDVGGIPWYLSSIVFHSGNSPKEGHFYTWARWQGQWYECNDTKISSVQSTSAGRIEVYDIPYVLIFKRMTGEIDGTEEIISYRYVQSEERKQIKQAKAKEVNEFEMDKFDSRMRTREKPATRVYYRISLIFTILFGAWWIIWLIFFGHYWQSPVQAFEYIVFIIAEIVNYLLNMIYFFNFWKPVNRRWRSLNNLKPEFTGRPTVNIIICHYQEDIDDTRRTFAACLNMITDGKVKVNIFICDDGFFENKGGKRVVSANGTKMNQMMREELIKYWSEKGVDNISMSVPIDIKTLENRRIVRPDCAVESNRYEFKPRRGDGKLLPGPHAFLIARVKPPVHHNKAGNLNNCIYNEQLKGEFVLFFDNDMAPLPKFLMRTVPWFFRQTKKARYRLDEGVAFVQCPQDFENVDTADFLGNRNSIFFKAIQKGRDGHDSCAFAGTNAMFLLKAIHSIGGIPYGTVTEDAYAGICLHKRGYRSVYLEEKLAIGLAPDTSAQSMVQRMRWVKVLCLSSQSLLFSSLALPSFKQIYHHRVRFKFCCFPHISTMTLPRSLFNSLSRIVCLESRFHQRCKSKRIEDW
eukprot:TRINITY_DN5156_c0_g1_i2.p1 TRINITY_DN5156_c0_g1~~TRINITY_DN5156_c0_g1_i2.p1  ORF type:complete len:1058 (+),score=261.33 TRINITY_DN5156_c0_g1_i2:293-3466(+)